MEYNATALERFERLIKPGYEIIRPLIRIHFHWSRREQHIEADGAD